MENNEQNDFEGNSHSFEDLNDLNVNDYGEGEPAPNEFNPDIGNINSDDDINNNINDIQELNVDINDNENVMNNNSEEDIEEQLNNQDFENENNLNEEGQDLEQEEINDNDNNEINEMNLNNDKDMNYMIDNNLEPNNMNNDNDNEINDNIDTNLQGNFNENNFDYNYKDNENNMNLNNMINMEQNEEMINNNDLDNMNELNNEENYNNNNNLETSDNQNNENNMVNEDNYININNLNNMNNFQDMNNNILKNQINNMDNINDDNMNINSDNYDPNINLNQDFEAGYDQEDEENLMNQNVNNEMMMNNLNNNYQIKNQQLLENIRDINQRFGDLEKDFKSLEKENKQLKEQLYYEKIKNKDIKPNDFLIYENALNKGKMFIEKEKQKNALLKNKIEELEADKNSLQYKLIEANQRIKRLQSDYNINSKEENKEQNNKNDKDKNNEITTLKNKLDEFEIANSKLNLDYSNLQKKMENMKKEYTNQIKLITNYKNSELTIFNKVILQYKEYFKNHNINPNVNVPNGKEKIPDNNNTNNNNNNNNNFDYGKIMVEMANKDKIIKSLNTKLDKYMSEYKNIIEEKHISQQKYNQLLFHYQKIITEKNDLIKKNQNLKMEIADLNQKIEMNKNKYKNIKYIHENNLIKMEAKLAEYKQKIITLKLRINEMLGYNSDARLVNQKSNINITNKPNLNNFFNKNQIPLTPTQKKVIPGMNMGDIRKNKRPEYDTKFKGNKLFNNMKNNNNF